MITNHVDHPTGSEAPECGGAAVQPHSSSPIDLAIVAVNAGAPPHSLAGMLLSKQGHLIDVDLRYRRLQMATERMSLTLRTLTVLVGVTIVAGAGAFVADASRAKGLVIEAFSVPPDMASDGVTGEVLASQLLDRLVRLDASVNSIRAPSTYENDWRGHVKVEIPQIGISLGELNRYLRGWLGNEKRVSGELFRSASGEASLTVRTAQTPGDTHVGSTVELGTLLDRAAESVYARTQPYRYGATLIPLGRFDEALTIFRALADGADATERPWGHIGIGNVSWTMQGDAAAVASYKKAVELDPHSSLALTNLANMERRLGLSQAMVDHIAQGIRAGETHAGGLSEVSRAGYLLPLRAEELLGRGDPEGASELYRDAKPQMGGLDNKRYGYARALVQLHQPVAALRVTNSIPVQGDRGLWVNAGNRLEVVMQAAEERHDWPEVLRASDAFLAAVGGSERGHVEMRRVVHWRALALAHSGRLREAQALIAPSPQDCYPCLIARGWIAELNRQPQEADRWFGAAVKEGPRLPFAHTQWGLALAERGDLEAATGQFRRAADVAPRFADPLKYWGDVLVRQGKLVEAKNRYAAAAQHAPRWGALHLDWGIAHQGAGKHEDARKLLASAGEMDLSASDQARLRVAGG